MIKQEFRIEVDLPLASDTLHTTTKDFLHAYDITEDVSDWDTDFELNNEAGLKLTIDNKTRPGREEKKTEEQMDSQEEFGATSAFEIAGLTLQAQTFTPQEDFILSRYQLRLSKESGIPIANLTVEIRNTNEDGSPDMSGDALDSSTITESELLVWTLSSWIEKDAILKPELKKGRKYCFVLKSPGSTLAASYLWLFINTNPYERGRWWHSEDGGTNWNIGSELNDLAFKTWGYGFFTDIPVAKYNKREIQVKNVETEVLENCNKGFYSNQFIRVYKVISPTEDELWFVGRIGNIKKSFDETGNMISLDCTDLTTFLKGVFVDKTYTNMEISLIIKQLFIDYPDTGITPDYVETTNIIISTCTFKDKNIYECIDELAKQSSFDWYVDAIGSLHFFRSGRPYGTWINSFEGDAEGNFPSGWTEWNNLEGCHIAVSTEQHKTGSKSCKFWNTDTVHQTERRMIKQLETSDLFTLEFWAKGSPYVANPCELHIGLLNPVLSGLIIIAYDQDTNVVQYHDRIGAVGHPFTLFAFGGVNPVRQDWVRYVIDYTMLGQKYNIRAYREDGTEITDAHKDDVQFDLGIENKGLYFAVKNFATSQLASYYVDDINLSPATLPTQTFEEGVNLISAEETEDSMSIANKISVEGASCFGEPTNLFEGIENQSEETVNLVNLTEIHPFKFDALQGIEIYPVQDGSGDITCKIKAYEKDVDFTVLTTLSEYSIISTEFNRIRALGIKDFPVTTYTPTPNGDSVFYVSARQLVVFADYWSSFEGDAEEMSWSAIDGGSLYITSSPSVEGSVSARNDYEGGNIVTCSSDISPKKGTGTLRFFIQPSVAPSGENLLWEVRLSANNTRIGPVLPYIALVVDSEEPNFRIYSDGPSGSQNIDTGVAREYPKFFAIDFVVSETKTTIFIEGSEKGECTDITSANCNFVILHFPPSTSYASYVDMMLWQRDSLEASSRFVKMDIPYCDLSEYGCAEFRGIETARPNPFASKESVSIQTEVEGKVRSSLGFPLPSTSLMFGRYIGREHTDGMRLTCIGNRPYFFPFERIKFFPKYEIPLKVENLSSDKYVFQINLNDAKILGFRTVDIRYTFGDLLTDLNVSDLEINLTNIRHIRNNQILQIDDEKMKVKSIAGYVVTVFSRGDLGTKASIHSAGAKVFTIIGSERDIKSYYFADYSTPTSNYFQGNYVFGINPAKAIPFTCIMNDPEHQHIGISEKKYTDPVLSDEVSNYLIGWHKLEQLSRPRGNISIRSLDINPFILGSLVEFGCDSIATDDFPCYCSLLGTDDAFKMRVRKISIKYDSTGLDCSAELSEYRKDEDKDLVSVIKEIKFEQNKKDKDAGTVEGISIEYWLIDNMTDVSEWYKTIGLTTSQEKSEVKYGTASTKMSMSMTPVDPTLWFKKEILTSQQKNWKDKHFLEMWFNTSLATSTVSDFRIDCYVYDKGGTVAFEVNDMTLADINEWIRIIVDIHETLEYTNTDLNENLTAEDTIVSVVDATLIDADDMIKIDDECMKVISVSLNDVTVIRGYYNTTATTHTIGAIIKKKGDALDIHEFMLSFSNHSATETITPVVYIDQISILKTTPDLAELPVELSP